MRSGLRGFTPVFTGPALLGCQNGGCLLICVRGYHPLWRDFPKPFHLQQLCNSVEGLVTLLSGPTTPYRQRHQAITPARFRLFPFRSPLLRESLLLSFPQGTEMFQFPWFPLPALCVQAGVPQSCCGGFPHSDIHGSKLGRQLPVAYRSHPRPSSALGAKASTVGSL